MQKLITLHAIFTWLHGDGNRLLYIGRCNKEEFEYTFGYRKDIPNRNIVGENSFYLGYVTVEEADQYNDSQTLEWNIEGFGNPCKAKNDKWPFVRTN